MDDFGSSVDDATRPTVYGVTLFGTFRVAAPDGTNATPPGRKARGLLAYLLLSDAGGASRERLAGLLWGERGEEQARASLRQSFYEMRAVAGTEVPLLSLDRTQARVVPGRVGSDLDRLRAFASGRDASGLADAIGERPAELLEDLDGLDPAFDDWLAAERTQRRDQRRRIALDVAGRALAAGDAPGAQRLAASLLAVDPMDEAAARVAMASAHARGDRDQARQMYARLVIALNKGAGAHPSEETKAFHRDLTATASAEPNPAGVGPAVSAFEAVRVALPAPQPQVTEPGVTAERPLPSPTPRARTWRRAAALAVVLLAAGAVFWWRPATDTGRRLLLVQPLSALPDDAVAEELGRGLSSDLARMIVGNDQRLGVVDSGQADDGIRRRAEYLITGSARNADGMLHADVQLVGRQDAVILWSKAFVRPAGELQAMREQIASKLADVTICALGGRNPSLRELGPDTLRLYLSACEHKHDDWSESAKLLTQIVQRQPDFAHAWAMLAAGTTASAYMRPNETQALHRQAEVYAAHALALDPHDGEAWYARSETLPGLGRWIQRMAVLQAGHAADPGNAPTNGRLADSLASVGRWKEAIAYEELAEDADPFSPGQAKELMLLLGFGPHLEDANDILQRARHRFPTLAFVNGAELAVEGLAGDPRRALALLFDPGRPLNLGPGRVELWQAVLAARIDPTPEKQEAAVRAVLAGRSLPGDLSAIEKLVVLKRLEAAYEAAESVDVRALPNGETERLFRSDMAAFRADPRFIRFAARLGLVSIWQNSGHWPDFCAEPNLRYDCQAEASRGASVPASVPPLARPEGGRSPS